MKAEKDGELLRSYAYDAFGNRTGMMHGGKETSYTYDVLNRLTGMADGLGEESYRYDRTAGTYFAQAREYMAWAGRFAGRDVIKGHTGFPETLNEYGYCRGNPMAFVDLNGMSPAPAEVQGILSDMLVGNYNQEAVDWASTGIGQAMEKIEEIEREINEWADENVGLISRTEMKEYIAGIPYIVGVYSNEITYAGESKLIDVTTKNGLFEFVQLNFGGNIEGVTIRGSLGIARDEILINTNYSWVSRDGVKNNIGIKSSILGGGVEWGQERENKISGGGYRISLRPSESVDIYNYNSGTGPLRIRNEDGVFISSGLLEAVAVVVVCGPALAAAPKEALKIPVKKPVICTFQQLWGNPSVASIFGFLGIDSIIDASCNRGEI